MLQLFPILGSILLTALFIGAAIYLLRRKKGFHSGGIVSGSRPEDFRMILHAADHANPAFARFRRSLRDILKRERNNFAPQTRKVLEVLDRMQDPAVREAVMPEIAHRYYSESPIFGVRCGFSPDSEQMEPYIGPEVTSEQPLVRFFYSDYDGPLEDGEEPPEDSWVEYTPSPVRHFSRYWRVEHGGAGAEYTYPQSAWVHQEPGSPFIIYDFETPIGGPLNEIEIRPYDPTTDAAERFFDSDGEPPVSPPPPNIGGEDHPPYAGPNYVERHEIADEMKGIRHYGTETSGRHRLCDHLLGGSSPDGHKRCVRCGDVFDHMGNFIRTSLP